MSESTAYRLVYWPGIPGRGEFVRLAFEYAGIAYDDPCQVKAVKENMRNPDKSGFPPHFAPPMLQLPSGQIISQTANILNYLAPKLALDGAKGLAGDEAEVRRAHVNQLVLTVLDLNDEAHDVHHPLGGSLYYEHQIPEAKRRATEDFRPQRLPTCLEYFASVLNSNKEGGSSGYLIGSETTTADLALFHVLTGLEFAFPRRMAKLKSSAKYAPVFKLKDRVEGSENIAKYLASSRRTCFSNGIFRHYPELDAEE